MKVSREQQHELVLKYSNLIKFINSNRSKVENIEGLKVLHYGILCIERDMSLAFSMGATKNDLKMIESCITNAKSKMEILAKMGKD